MECENGRDAVWNSNGGPARWPARLPASEAAAIGFWRALPEPTVPEGLDEPASTAEGQVYGDARGDELPEQLRTGRTRLGPRIRGTTLRDPQEEPANMHVLPSVLVAFQRGPDGAHHVFNASDAPARVLLISTMHLPDVAEHVDTGAALAITGPGAGKTFPAGSDRPTLELVVEAMRAAES